MLCALCVGQASALEYTMEAPDDYLFGRPTSDDTIYEWEDPNVDRSKNTALIPPGFGTPTSYLPGSGDPLTPNLIPGALDGGGLVSQTGSVNYPVIDTGNGGSSGQDVGYTAVTSDLYYSGGHLGTLKIPAIGLSTKVYEGTDSSTLAKGAGHFPGTSIWDGNCCIAGHNRGVRDDFGDLHTLEPGDTITWTTKLGTRTYQVVSVLDKYNCTEEDAKQLCQRAGLLSPVYTFTTRGGCWFCPNAKRKELRHLYDYHPNLWKRMLELQALPNKVSEKFNRSETFSDIDAEFRLEDAQESLFQNAA